MAAHPPNPAFVRAFPARLSTALALVAVFFCVARATRCVLTDISISRVPKIADGRMAYSMDLVFDRAPVDCWVHYDAPSSVIIVDMYGDTLDNAVGSLPRNLVFKSISMRNMSTTMSLSGVRAQIGVSVDSGWSASLAAAGQDTLRLTVSRVLVVKPSNARATRRRVLYVLTTTLAGLAAVTALTFLNHSMY